jgi:hypothetical protein
MTSRVEDPNPERYVGGAANWRGRTALDLPYKGTTPIATCHWQWIANVLAADGFASAWEHMGLSWGCRQIGPVLFGLASWPALLREVCGAEVEIRTYESAQAARDDELSFSAAGWPLVAEVDSRFLTEADETFGDEVHAVLVVERGPERVRLVDDRVGPTIWTYTRLQYEEMRASPCEWRAEPHKLYVVRGPATRRPAPSEVFELMRDAVRRTSERSVEVLRDYVDAVARSEVRADVCRAAGERFQAARTLEYLSTAGVAVAGRPAELLHALSNDWYLAHMLATYPGGEEERIHARLVELLRKLPSAEIEAAEVMMG